MQLLASHRLTQAVRIFQEVIRREPQCDEAHHALGLELETAGELVPAKEAFRPAIALAPDLRHACFNLARVLQQRGELDEAINWYKRAIELHPTWGEAHDALGNILGQRGNLLGAKKEFEVSVKAQPEFALAHYRLAMTEWLLHDLAGALAGSTALRLLPTDSQAHYYLGLAYQQQGKLDEARRELEEAVKLDPHSAKIDNSLGVSFNRRETLSKQQQNCSKR